MHLIVSVGNSVQLNWFLRVLPKFCSTTKRNPPLNDDEIYIFLNAAYKNFNQLCQLKVIEKLLDSIWGSVELGKQGSANALLAKQ